jgi:hypothetical protein
MNIEPLSVFSLKFITHKNVCLLDELESSPGGMEEGVARRRVFQIIKAIAFCHANSVSKSNQ